MEQETGFRKLIKDCYNSTTAVFIITNSDEWVSGYLTEEPKELYCTILNWKDKKARRLHYSNLHVVKEFEGDYSQLPIPDYLKEVRR